MPVTRAVPRQRHHHRAVQRARPGRHAEPPARSSSAGRPRPADETAVRADDPSTLARRAFRRPVADADVAPLLTFFSREPRAAGSKRASSWRSAGSWSARSSSSASKRRRRAVPPGRNYRVSDLELASRLSFFLWSSIPDDELLDLAAQRRASRSGRARTAGAADAGRSAVRGLRQQFRRPVAAPPQPRGARARELPVPGLRRQPAAGVAPRNGAVLRQHPAREPQRARAADGGLHVRQRAAGPPLRDSERVRQPLPARDDSPMRNRRGLLGQASILCRDLAPQPDVAGVARQVDSGKHPRRRRRRTRRRTCRPFPNAAMSRTTCSRSASGWLSTVPTRRARRATR